MTRRSRRRRPELHLRLRRAYRRHRPRPAAAHARGARDHAADAAEAELIWASPREVLNIVQADEIGCHIITVTHDLLGKLELARQGSRPVFARDRADVPSRRRRRPDTNRASRPVSDLAVDARSSPAAPASSVATSPTGCWPTASRSSSTTTSRPAGAFVERLEARQRASCRRGRRPRRRPACARRWRAATSSSTSPRTPMSATASSTRSATSSRTRSARSRCSRRCALPASGASCSRSTGSVYGEPEVFPTPEDCPFPGQTSLYGARSSPARALIQAYCEGYGFSGVIFRFVSILGERYTHGHLFDFYRALLDDPTRLDVLGDGHQRKSYLYVGDCIDAIMLAARSAREAGRRRLQPRHRRGDGSSTTRSQRSRRHLGVEPELDLHRRRARLGRRQPADPPRLRAPAGARLGAEADDRRGDRPHAALVRRQPLGLRARTRVMSVIFTRAPLRISLGGGGTDLPSLLPRARRIPRRGRDRQVRLHADPHGLPAPLPAEVLGVRGSRRPARHQASRSCARRSRATGHGSPLEIASLADIPAGTGLGSSGAFTVCLLKALALAGRQATRPARSRRRPATSRSTCSASRSASRTSTPRRTAASAPTRSIPTTPSTVESLRSPRRPRTRCATASALLHRRDAERVGDPARPGHAHPRARRGDAREPASHQGDRPREPRAARVGRPDALRRADARALGQQARALERDVDDRDRRSLRARARATGRSAASSSAPAVAASCSSTRADPAATRAALTDAGAPEVRFGFDFQGCIGLGYRDRPCASGSSAAG